MAVEHKITLATREQRNERQRGTGLIGQDQLAGVNAITVQRISQEVTKLILSHLTHKARRVPQARYAHSNIGWSATKGFFECNSLRKSHIGFCGDKVNEQFAAGNDIHRETSIGSIVYLIQVIVSYALKQLT